jgi:asparagine synthase (glutamine-hydrolysing)
VSCFSGPPFRIELLRGHCVVHFVGVYSLTRNGYLDEGALSMLASRLIVPRCHARAFLIRGSIAVFVAQLRTTLEDGLRDQPAISTETGSISVFDGHIDNRDEISNYMFIQRPPSTINDAELMLGSYESQGISAFRHIIGHFACIIDDEANSQLVCARDCFGVCPLYYAANKDFFFFCSQLQPLLSAPGISKRIDQEYLADLVAVGSCQPPRTAFEAIHLLRPGHVLTVSVGATKITRYYDFEPTTPALNSDHDYEEYFLHLFRCSLDTTLRSSGKISGELSGGHDSSAIITAAACWFPERALNSDRFCTLTLAQGTDASWAEHVLCRYPLANHRIEAEQYPLFGSLVTAGSMVDEPSVGVCDFELHKAASQIFQAQNIVVNIRGVGAESAMLGDLPAPIHLADYLRQGRWIRLLKEMPKWQQISHAPWRSFLLEACLRPLFRRNSAPTPSWRTIPGWISPEFVRKTHFSSRIRGRAVPPRFRNLATQYHYELLGRSRMLLARSYTGLYAETRYPFLYRPLVEFFLAAPMEQKVRPNERKSLMRRALSGILPEAIRDRRGKGDVFPYTFSSLNRNWHEVWNLFDNSMLAELGCIDNKLFRQALIDARAGYAPQALRLQLLICVEAWLQGSLRSSSRSC